MRRTRGSDGSASRQLDGRVTRHARLRRAVSEVVVGSTRLKFVALVATFALSGCAESIDITGRTDGTNETASAVAASSSARKPASGVASCAESSTLDPVEADGEEALGGRPEVPSRREILDTEDEDLPILVWGYTAGVDLESHPEWETFWLVELLNYEIGNGGLVRYFHNTRGEFAEDTLRALDVMGATQHRETFATAVDRWCQERDILEALWADGDDGFSRSYEVSSLSALDDRWYDRPIERVEAAFIRANIDAFTSV